MPARIEFKALCTHAPGDIPTLHAPGTHTDHRNLCNWCASFREYKVRSIHAVILHTTIDNNSMRFMLRPSVANKCVVP